MAMIAFAGLRSSASTVLLDTTGGVPSWRRLQQQHLECQRVTGGHINNINNNVNTSSIKPIANTLSNIKTIANTMSNFTSLHRLHVRVVEGLSWWMVFDVLLLL